jgi:hypothetical protein
MYYPDAPASYENVTGGCSVDITRRTSVMAKTTVSVGMSVDMSMSGKVTTKITLSEGESLSVTEEEMVQTTQELDNQDNGASGYVFLCTLFVCLWLLTL